ncbi:MAG TPA: DNA-3-methyladenine glycosylase I [Acidimicrobiales bacterium]|jgi:DNA-3-methyladenine glycosylase I|nr:DNA-3-methyladenine glycosylase I [Acidimicrobiales bacterium]
MAEVVVGEDGVPRCWWGAGDALRSYHDLEWGRPVADDNRLFEKLCLEGFQSGLSWLTILRKRENFRRAFKSFDVDTVARFNLRTVERLLQDAGIVRNRAKIEATINNARRCRELRKESGSLAAYVWSFEPAATGVAPTDAAKVLSKDLKRRGWAFVGPTTVFSFMEAMGLVNNHLAGCAAHDEVDRLRATFQRPE